jgi:formylglycine-generating enzyme required for sulfatase activity
MNKLIGRISAALLIFSTSIAAHASLAIYSYKGSSTTIGGEKATAVAQTGSLVIDLDTMSATYVGQFTKGKGKNKETYYVKRLLSNTINTQISGPKGKSYTVMATAETPGTQYTGSVLHFEGAKGLNSLLTIKTGGAPQTKWLPKVMSTPAYIVTQDLSAVDYATEVSGTYTFNSARTIENNNSGKSLDQAVSELENSFKAQNYIEWAAGKLVGMPAPAPIPSALMVSVQGGALPQGSELAGQQVNDFEIGRYEVTWGDWKEVRDWAVLNDYTDLAGVGDTFPAGSPDNFPVIKVSWYDVVKWCNAKSEKDGKTPVYQASGGGIYKIGESVPTINVDANGYRLLKETEWEWAARGGVSGVSHNYVYSGSNTLNEVAWMSENSSSGSKAVGTKGANELGVYDMSGNVWEWCEDMDRSYRRNRGGGWNNIAVTAAVAYRYYDGSPDTRGKGIGFRLARNSGN